jgi:hypothetical protein
MKVELLEANGYAMGPSASTSYFLELHPRSVP